MRAKKNSSRNAQLWLEERATNTACACLFRSISIIYQKYKLQCHNVLNGRIFHRININQTFSLIDKLHNFLKGLQITTNSNFHPSRQTHIYRYFKSISKTVFAIIRAPDLKKVSYTDCKLSLTISKQRISATIEHSIASPYMSMIFLSFCLPFWSIHPIILSVL